MKLVLTAKRVTTYVKVVEVDSILEAANMLWDEDGWAEAEMTPLHGHKVETPMDKGFKENARDG